MFDSFADTNLAFGNDIDDVSQYNEDISEHAVHLVTFKSKWGLYESNIPAVLSYGYDR